MRTVCKLVPFALVFSLGVSSLRAQLTYTFETQIGSGAFTLNTNNLVSTGNGGSFAGYHDTLDSFAFKGFTYTNLDFTVYNNSYIVFYRDGFQILVNKSPYDSSARLEIDVVGNSSVVSGVSIADLVTVLSSFDALQTNLLMARVVYNDPNPPYEQQIGNVTSFQRLQSLTIGNAGVQGNQFGFDIVGQPGATAVVEVCTLASTNAVWSPVQTNALTSSAWHFNDPSWSNHSQQFYRIRIQ